MRSGAKQWVVEGGQLSGSRFRGADSGQDIEREIEGRGDRGDSEERGRRDATGLDLAERFGGDAGAFGDLGHASVAAGAAQEIAEALATGAFFGT